MVFIIVILAWYLHYNNVNANDCKWECDTAFANYVYNVCWIKQFYGGAPILDEQCVTQCVSSISQCMEDNGCYDPSNEWCDSWNCDCSYQCDYYSQCYDKVYKAIDCKYQSSCYNSCPYNEQQDQEDGCMEINCGDEIAACVTEENCVAAVEGITADCFETDGVDSVDCIENAQNDPNQLLSYCQDDDACFELFESLASCAVVNECHKEGGNQQEEEWEYAYEDIPDCIKTACAETLEQCASSDACIEGIEGIANGCYINHEDPAECMDSLITESQGAGTLQLCDDNGECANDLQALGECIINSANYGHCDAEQDKKFDFRALVKTVKRIKERKGKGLNKRELSQRRPNFGESVREYQRRKESVKRKVLAKRQRDERNKDLRQRELRQKRQENKRVRQFRVQSQSGFARYGGRNKPNY